MSQRIKRIRSRRGFTQQQLADAAGVTRVHLARLETESIGTIRPNAETIRRVANALGVDDEWLRTGSKLPVHKEVETA